MKLIKSKKTKRTPMCQLIHITISFENKNYIRTSTEENKYPTWKQDWKNINGERVYTSDSVAEKMEKLFNKTDIFYFANLYADVEEQKKEFRKKFKYHF